MAGAFYHAAMAIIVFQHSDVVGPGRLGVTLRDHGFLLDIRRPDKGCPVPSDLDNVQGVIILGGSANVTDIALHAWMSAEAEFIRKAHAAQLPVIGICLGAQLIAHALGGQVGAKAKGPELGFSTLSINTTGQTETLLAGLQWNHPQLFSCGQEITQLPAGAQLFASTPGTKNACFKTGIRTFGSIFHFECDRQMISALYKADPQFVASSGKTLSDLEAEADRYYANFARHSDRLALNLVATLFPQSRR